MEHTIDDLRRLLADNVLEITFTKLDGTHRVMLASTNMMYIPERTSESKSPDRNPSDRVLTVVDIEIGQWRAIVFDRIETYVITSKPVLQKFNETPEMELTA